MLERKFGQMAGYIKPFGRSVWLCLRQCLKPLFVCCAALVLVLSLAGCGTLASAAVGATTAVVGTAVGLTTDVVTAIV